MTPVENLPRVSTTTVVIFHRYQQHWRQNFAPASVIDISCKLATGVKDNGEKFAASINDTGGKFATGVST
jgi:hypothetical protein